MKLEFLEKQHVSYFKISTTIGIIHTSINFNIMHIIFRSFGISYMIYSYIIQVKLPHSFNSFLCYAYGLLFIICMHKYRGNLVYILQESIFCGQILIIKGDFIWKEENFVGSQKLTIPSAFNIFLFWCLIPKRKKLLACGVVDHQLLVTVIGGTKKESEQVGWGGGLDEDFPQYLLVSKQTIRWGWEGRRKVYFNLNSSLDVYLSSCFLRDNTYAYHIYQHNFTRVLNVYTINLCLNSNTMLS